MAVLHAAVLHTAVSTVDTSLATVDLIGVFFSAILGGVIARRQGFDPVGFAVLALLSGLGGGIIRDVILQVGPPVAFRGYTYIAVALAGGAVAFVLRTDAPVWRRTWPVVDALALGAWAAAGAQRAVVSGLGWLPAIVVGTISAVGGGMVRDVVIRQVPTVLGGNTLYATCAVAASGVMVLFLAVGSGTTGTAVSALFGATLCLLARRYGWILPSGDGWAHRHPGRARRRERRHAAR